MSAKRITLALIAVKLLLTSAGTAQAAGTVIGWGQNNFNQATNAGSLLNMQAVAAGSDNSAPNSLGFSLALNPNGTISAWGNNNYGQTSIPASANSNIIAIAAGEYHGVSLNADGKVFAWGNNANRQTNLPSILSSNVIAIAAGGSGTDANGSGGTHSLALRSDGTVVAWGRYQSGQTNVPAGLSNVVAIAAGSAFSLALKSDGTVAVWGSTVTGATSQTNVPGTATNVVAIAAGSLHCLALRTNGTVIAWGINSVGQTAVPISASNVVAIAAGDQHSMALRRDGTIVVWGNPIPSLYTFTVPAGVSNFTAIASAGRHALATYGDGTPGITVPPRYQSVYPGGRAVFVVMAAGPGTLTYQWQANGINIPGATGPILTLTNVQPANSGWYQVTVRNTFGADTASAGLTLLDGRVTITQQPASTTAVDANSNTVVSVTAVGGIPISYQWWKDGAVINGATNASYAITNAQTANAGGYSVVVSNVYGSVMSSTGSVSVVYHAPIVVLQPVGTNVPVGGTFTLRSSATGTTPLSWQWRTNGTPIPGANATNYVVNAAQLGDAATYDVVVSNSAGSTNSTPAVVNVGYPPGIASSPQPVTGNVGDTVNFSCVVTGTPPFGLQWTLNGYVISNQTGLSLTLPNVQTTNIGLYALVATNIFGSTASSNAALNLNGYDFSQTAGLVAYYALNGDATDSSGFGNDGTNFNVVGTFDRFGNTNAAMYFQGTNNYIRCKNGAYFASRFTVTAWLYATNYSYYSRILDFGNGAAVDNTDLAFSQLSTGNPYLEVYNGTSRLGDCQSTLPLSLNKWVQVVGTCDGSQINIYADGLILATVNAVVSRPQLFTTLNYIGRSNWKASGGDQDFAGSFDEIRILNRALSANEVAHLYALEADVPVITQSPQAQTVAAGATVSFSVAATANHPLTYQWRTNGIPIIGATNSVLTISNVQSANIGFYSVAVSNSVAGAVSSAALLNLTGAADPTMAGVIAYYPLDGTANDAGTNALHGVVNNGAVWTTNRFGYSNGALRLDGSTGFVSVSDPAARLNFDIRSNNYTITTWVCLNSLQSSSDQCILIDRGTKLNPPTSYTLVYSPGINKFFIQMWDGLAFVQVNSAFPVSAGLWYQLAVVVENRVVTLFVNGVNKSVPAANGGIAPANFGTTKNAEGIRNFGRFAYTDYANYLNGSLDDIRFYNRALSADEVSYLYDLESTSAAPASPILTGSLVGGPAFALSLNGQPGSNYVLQLATNLTAPVQWLSIFTNAAGTNGLWQFTETNLDGPLKFYRVVTP